jgi:hypothetical protein
MPLPTRTFDQFVSDQQASLQVAQPLFTFSPGSVVQALSEANAGLGLFFQYLTYKVLESTRLASCEGADCDSFGADFLFARYPAVSSTGQVVFQRFTAPNQLLIPLGTVVRTIDNVVSFTVIADQFNAAYDAGLQGYVMNPGVMTCSVLVQAVTPGSIGNVEALTITKCASSLAIGAVSNPAPFLNGVDQESDAAYKNRFQLYINTRSASTRLAIENAIISTDPIVTYTINENVTIDSTGKSTPLPGNVAIFVDDGTGFPPQILFTGTLATPGLWGNIENVRPAAISFTVEPANPISVSIEMSTTWNSGYNRNNYVGAISTAVINYINLIPVGQNLYLTRLYQVVYDSVPGALKDVYDLLVNGEAADLIVPINGVVRFIAAIPAGSSLPVSEMTID